jgi:hypothetical protein
MTEGGKVKLQSRERVPQQHASTAEGYLGQSQISDDLVTTESKRGRGRPKVEGPRPALRGDQQADILSAPAGRAAGEDQVSLTKRQGIGGRSKIRKLSQLGDRIINRQSLNPAGRNGRRVMQKLRVKYGDEFIDQKIDEFKKEAEQRSKEQK